jgi:hypothetical protein
MRVYSLFTFCLSVIIFGLCGCTSHDSDVEARRNFSVKHVQQAFVNARSPMFCRWGTNILSVLSSVNALAIKGPLFASATMGRAQDGEYRIWVFWLEDRPSVDGFELLLAKTNSTVIIPISTSDREENMKSSKVAVVMVARDIWHNTDDIWNKLESIKDVSVIKVRLLREGAPVSEWCPVSFYRVDHWMGSKEVMEVTAGPGR